MNPLVPFEMGRESESGKIKADKIQFIIWPDQNNFGNTKWFSVPYIIISYNALVCQNKPLKLDEPRIDDSLQCNET